MNPSDLLQEGINAVRSGNKKEGAQKLAQVVQQDNRNAEAWFWLAAATDDQEEAAACLKRALKIDANHTRARQALESIEQGARPSSTQPQSAYTAPDSPGNMRPLNTGELLSGAFDSPYGSYTPPPVSKPDAPTRAMPVVSPPPFGAERNTPAQFSDLSTPAPPIGNEPTPPPPFGMPAWANQAPPTSRSASTDALGGTPTVRMQATGNISDPYASTGQPPGMAVPPPPFQAPGGRGLTFGQLDPAAAKAAEEAALQPPPIVDPGADLRARLLGATPPPPPQPATGRSTFTPDPNQKQAPAKARKKGGFKPIYLLLAFVVLFAAAAVAILLLRPGTTTIIDGTPVGDVTATTTIEVTTTAAATTAAGTTTAVVQTTAVVPTTAAQTTARPTTTVAATTTAVVPTTTAAPTTARPVTTAAPTTVAPTTVRPTTTAAPVTTLPPVVTTGAGIPVTPPQISLPVFPADIPLPVQNYVRDSINNVNALGFVEGNINRLMLQPFRENKLRADMVIGNEELDFYLLTAGQIAKKVKEISPVDGTQDLNLLSNDYANHITSILQLVDRYKITGQPIYMQQAVVLYDKSRSERNLFAKVLEGGYPYKIPPTIS